MSIDFRFEGISSQHHEHLAGNQLLQEPPSEVKDQLLLDTHRAYTNNYSEAGTRTNVDYSFGSLYVTQGYAGRNVYKNKRNGSRYR